MPTAKSEAFRRDNRTFDPMDFYTPGPGKDGVTISGRIPMETRHLINQVVSSRETPFTTPGEFVRAACVWFAAEVVPKFKDARFDEGLKRLHQYIEGAARDSVLLNVTRLQFAAKDKILKMMAIGAATDAAAEYLKMIEVAEDTHPKFGRIVKGWAEQEPAFAAVRVIVEKIEAEERVTDASVCACGHRYDAHRIVVNEDTGEVHTDCRPKKGGKVVVCPCEEWMHERREVER